MEFERKLTERVHQIDYFHDLFQHRLNALVICISEAWGGLEQIAASDILDLVQAGFSVSVLCLRGSPIFQHLSPHSGPRLRISVLGFRPRNFLDFKFRHVLENFIEEGVNLIHVHQPSLLGSVAPWLWNQPRVALLASRHIMSDHSKKDFFHRMLYQRVDVLMVMSQMLRKNVLDTHAIRERTVQVVNYGLDFRDFDPQKIQSQRLRSEWGVEKDQIAIGLVGRIDPAKGQATFIRAAAGLKMDPELQGRLKFILVGEETRGREQTYMAELKQLIRDYDLEASFVFAGFRKDIPQVMAALDICVMPSRQETFGLVAIEAMIMECPVVISRGGSAAEIVGADECGLTVRPDDPFDLQRQLRSLLKNPALMREMGKKGRQHVIQHYDRSQRLLKTLSFYERALRRRRVL